LELLLAVTAGTLYGAGFYLMLRRRLAQLIVGLGLLSNGTNLLIFTGGGLTRVRAPIIPEGQTTMTGAFADPVPQSLVLTAIVIGFGVLAFALVLAHRVHVMTDSDDVDQISKES
jgi:multicomponent Na+:H+ antiporter subunit C